MGAGNKRPHNEYHAKDRKQFNNDVGMKKPKFNLSASGLELLITAIIFGVGMLIYGLYWLNKNYGGQRNGQNNQKTN